MTHPPQGWYPDPTGQSAYRRWDGEKWSDLTSNDPSSPDAVVLSPHEATAPGSAARALATPAPGSAAQPHEATAPGSAARALATPAPGSAAQPHEAVAPTHPQPLDDLFPSRPASPATLRRRRWRKALAWTLIASALLIQMGAIGMLAVENLSLETQVLEQRQEINDLKRQHEEENERREQEAKTQATAWCAGVSVENRRAVPELFMKYQRAARLTQQATQNECADRVAIAHAVSEVDFSLLQSIAIEECSQLPGQDTALVRGTLTYSGPSEGTKVSDTLSTGDVWIDVTLVGSQSASPAATTRVEAVTPGESRNWEVTLPYAGLSDIHSCRIHSVSWWPSNAL